MTYTPHQLEEKKGKWPIKPNKRQTLLRDLLPILHIPVGEGCVSGVSGVSDVYDVDDV
jgi:hypothetical protein